jgi:hypothetical protein
MLAENSVAKDLYASPKSAANALGMPVRNATHYVVIRNDDRFKPQQDGYVGYGGDGSQYSNTNRMPKESIVGIF